MGSVVDFSLEGAQSKAAMDPMRSTNSAVPLVVDEVSEIKSL